MRLILTHEHADFDAIAAQLAAYLLDPAAVPVLPRQINHNVRDFLTIYRGELPHQEADDLPRGVQVEAVTVVDTQRVLTVRGMQPHTPADIIDHHPPDPALPDHHQFFGEQVGATTTLLVEQLRESGHALKMAEATLLMLGIYEDTGSLLYGTTTPRDIAAAAWLASQGADLDVVRRFLQHPLTDEQRALYDTLLAQTTVRELHGHSVVIAVAEVAGYIDQISTVAHKLSDLLEPHALFMLVMLGSRLQIVARSKVDEIDVGQIMDRMGGGGHRRAAAALIEDASLDAERLRLEGLLDDLVQPLVSVADLMSVGVQTVAPDVPIAVVAEKMKRSGHEGYPVVEEGVVVGLLTRSAVDRAMSHQMGRRPVGHIMDSGQVVVRPADSIHTVQQHMLRSGWGQIPVVDDDDTLIGIVTRTDLIKHWGQPDNGHSRRVEIVRRLEQALSPALLNLLKAVGQRAQAMNQGLYAVGGFPRDLLLERPTTDIDLVVEGDAIALVRALRGQYGGRMRQHRQFGTATWTLDTDVIAHFGQDEAWPETLDFVTSRTEFYESPTALPTVSQSSIKLDLHRRDFSINTLAIRLAPQPFGHLLDFWGGERDLQEGVIRVLHSMSFIDDPTRILRAARFEQRFAFHIEDRTADLIRRDSVFLERISGPRIRHELELILYEDRPERALRRLQELGVLVHLSPQLVVDNWLAAALAALRYLRQTVPWPEVAQLVDVEHPDRWLLVQFVVLTCRLEMAEAERLGRRLQVKRKTLDDVLEGIATYARRLPALHENLPPSAVARLLDDVRPLGLMVAWAIAPTQAARAQIVQYATTWRDVTHRITPDEMRALGVRPGPAYGRLIRRLRAAWLDGEIESVADERALVAQLVAAGWGEDDHADD